MTTEKKPDNDPLKSFEDQFKEMLRHASVSFIPGMPPQQQDRPPAATPPTDKAPQPNALEKIRSFNMKPRDVAAHLDRYVIGQTEAKQVLSVAICDHYNHIRRCMEDPEFAQKDHVKHHIILLGPTGVGKTYLTRCIAKLIGVPFIKADATKFSETGYVGHDVEDLVRDLVKTAGGDLDLAQYGIIFLDEVDKIASQSGGGKDVSGRGVQVNLLKLMEETDVSLFSQTDIVGQFQAIMEMQKGRDASKRTINTRHMLFIVSGAFSNLPAIVRRRIQTSRIGFAAPGQSEVADETLLRSIETRDFIDYGFEAEFIGRLPVRVVCDALSVDDLQKILLTSEGSILAQYQAEFEGYGIALDVTPDAIQGVAEKAHIEKTGARGLATVLERTLRKFKYELPSTNIRSLRIDGTTIADPQQTLTEIMKNATEADPLKADVFAFADQFKTTHGIALTFTPEAVDEIVTRSKTGNVSVDAFCREAFHDLEYALKLISRNSGKTSFRVTKKLVTNPGEEISKMVVASFQKQTPKE